MFHQTNVNIRDAREGPVYLKFGTAKVSDQSGSRNLVCLGIELSENGSLTPIRSDLMMSEAEAIRLSDELRWLASLLKR